MIEKNNSIFYVGLGLVGSFLEKFLQFEVGLTFFDPRTKGKIGSGAGLRGMEGPGPRA